MSHVRENAHRLIDRLPEFQLSAPAGLLETIVEPVLRNFGLTMADFEGKGRSGTARQG
jgi:hypothetical protein